MQDGIFSIGQERGIVLTFDLEGRIIFAALNGYTVRRSLLGKYVKITLRNRERTVEPLRNDGIEVALANVRETLDSFAASVDDASIKDRLGFFRSRANADWLSQDAMKLERIYHGGVPIVPPDQYFSLYIRYTRGCSWNRCTFCRLYPGIEYGVLSTNEVENQIEKLKEALGNGMKSRRTVFIGDANAISTRTDKLIETIELIRKRIGLPVYAFSDAFTTPRNKGLNDYLLLREVGLSRVYVGIESGNSDILRIFNKPMDLNVARDEITIMKKSGISVGAIVMSGAGGKRFYEQHLSGTVDFLSSLPLGRGDIVYVSPLVVHPDSNYSSIAAEMGLGIMTEEENLEQTIIMRNMLREKWKGTHGEYPEFPIAPYLLAESIY